MVAFKEELEMLVDIPRGSNPELPLPCENLAAHRDWSVTSVLEEGPNALSPPCRPVLSAPSWV
jgi:hypothetical protein